MEQGNPHPLPKPQRDAAPPFRQFKGLPPASVHVDQRTTSGISKTSTYYLDLAGNVYQVVYPYPTGGATGRVVNYAFDNANRPKTAADGSNGITYATDFQTAPTGCLSGAVCYTPQGTFYALSIGQSSTFTGLNLTHTYNNRLQPLEFKASSSGGNAMDITYGFADPANTYNAGHVFSITNNLDGTRSQTFSYDQLNRISSALTTSTHATSPSHCWGENFTIDPWGNLNSIAATTNSNYTGCSQESGFTGCSADANNHLSCFGYDLAGNASSDSFITNYQWDAESQLKSAAGVNYLYDGDGRRVSKSNSKLYWYGSGGEVLAETNSSGTTTAEDVFFGGKRIAMLPAGGNPTYYIEDLLGTSRVLTTNTGVVCYDADFYPYGGERSYTNTCPQNYKFEGKERDTETGNDDFGARYYSNRFGRWLSADWSAVPVPVPYANLAVPQTLNLYAMVADDPETIPDLLGHEAGYYYAPDGHMIAPNEPGFPQSAHPIRDTILMGLGTVAALAAPAASVGVVARNLLGWALGTAPVTLPILNDLSGGMTPGRQTTLTRAGALGVSEVEKLGETGFVGTLSNGAKISAGFEKIGDTLGVNISNIQTAARGSINFKALESSAEKLAASEGSSSVQITASNVTNSKLADLLKKAEYVAQQVKDNFGRVTTNYVKKIVCKDGKCQ